jgi:phosphoglycerate dehydrogenase-like enzyme
MSESDCIVCSAPSTVKIQGVVDAEALEHVKQNAVFMNLGRWTRPVVDVNALIQALKDGKAQESGFGCLCPRALLPQDNELWELENVLLSPHATDQTARFMHETTATKFSVNENLPRFICGEDFC